MDNAIDGAIASYLANFSGGGGGATELAALTDVQLTGTKKNGEVLSWNETVGKWVNSLQMIYDAFWPKGSIYIGFAAPNVPTGVTATWVADSSYNGRALWVDSTKNTGTTMTGLLPTVTTTSAGAHTHEYQFCMFGEGDALLALGSQVKVSVDYDTSESAGAHTHTINSGVYTGADNTVRPTSVVVGVWKRTA